MPSKSPITPEDLYDLKHAEDPQISPDGRYVAYVVRTLSKLDNAYDRHIWLQDLTDRNAKPRQFTFGAKSDLSPRWRPDSTALAFVSVRSGKPQIYLIGLNGGEAQALTSMANGAGSPTWSFDGSQLAFVSSVNAEERRAEDSGEKSEPPADALEARHRKERQDDAERLRSDPRVIQTLPYRTGTSYYDDRTSHIYVMDVALDGTAGAPRRLTEGEQNYNHIAWFPDGRAILSSQSSQPEHDPWFHQRPVRIPTTGKRRATFLTPPGFEYFESLVSPDGRWIAATRQLDDASWGEPSQLVVFPARGGAVIERALELDRSVGNLTWSADSRSVYFTVEDRGDNGLYRIDALKGTARRIVGGRRVVLGYTVADNNRVAFTAHTPDGPPDVHVCEANGRRERAITDLNKDWRANHAIATFEEIWHTAPDGRQIQGWLVLPPGAKRGDAKRPLLLNMHGGPWVMWGPSVPEVWHEVQVHAAAGYVVYYCNPRGSLGYGAEHALLIRNDWGNHVMHDILSGVDNIMERANIDPKRMAVTGGSYAGYMTAWIIGHDQRFACAWAQRGLYNLTSFFGTSDIPQLVEREFEVRGFEDVERLWSQSPLAYVENMHTPLVIEHQDNDWRCPPSEGEQLFAALKRLGRTVTLLRYPRDGHEMTRSGEPLHRVDRLNRMLDWFGTYCMPRKGARGTRSS